MATIKDVAEKAGVSVATVSNYLNKTKPVSRQASLRIAQAIEEVQYTPNIAAKSLKSNSYKNIGIILPSLNDSYYVQIFQGIESTFRNTEYFLNVEFSYDIPELETKIVADMLKRKICGMIVVSCQPDKWRFYYENFNRQERPLVLIDRRIANLDANLVSFDGRRAMEMLTKNLRQAGYENLFLMAGTGKFSCEEACISGFLDAYPQGSGAVITIELNKEDAFRKTTGLLRQNRPDAILATSELAATGIAEALHVLGYELADIPVITFGEEHWNRHTHSFASFSVDRPAIKIGSIAANTLMEDLRSPATQESEQIMIACDSDKLQEAFHQFLHSEKTEMPTIGSKKRIRVLMLDTPAVHSFCRLLESFTKTKGIDVEVVCQAHNTLYDTIVQDSSCNNPEEQFDIYMYDIPWLPMLASEGIIRDLTDELPQIHTESFLPGCLEYYSHYRDRYYGIPLMYAPQMLYYRKSLFTDPILCAKYEKLYNTPLRLPRTFTEFNTIAKFFTLETTDVAYGISVCAAYPECLAPELYMRLRAYDSEVIDCNGNVVYNNPNTLKACVNLIRAVKYAKPDYLQCTDVDAVDSFLRGETAMVITYPGFLTNASDLRKNNRLGSIGCSYIPGRSPLLGGWGLGINRNSPKLQECLAFLNWTSGERMANYFSMLGGYTAVTSSYTNDELVNLYPWLSQYKDIYPYTRPMLPSVRHGGTVVSLNDIDAIVCKGLYKLLNRECEIEPVLAETHRELEILLNT